jgi:hypothetical protein
MGNVISSARLYIDYSGGNFQLKRVESLDEDDDSDTTVVTAIGVSGGAGNQDKEGGGKLKLEVFREDVPEVNYRRLKISKEFFSITVQDNPGERWQYQGVRVAKVARKINTDGKLMDSVDCTWQQRVQLPAAGG